MMSTDTPRGTCNTLFENDGDILQPPILRPDALSTNRYDDAPRLLRAEPRGAFDGYHIP